MVAVLPLPVTPSSVCARSPRAMPCARAAMAAGWSPAGRNGEMTSNFGMMSVVSLKGCPQYFGEPGPGPCENAFAGSMKQREAAVMATAKPVLFAGNSNLALAEEIAKKMGTRLGNALVTTFANEECRVEIRENVRGADVFVVQSLCKPPDQSRSVNDALMELLLMIDALRRASAARITAVIPYYGYAKQDKKTKGREPISAKVVANLLKVTGAKRIVTMDLHAAQIQGFFDIPVDNLMAMPVLCNYLKKEGLCDDKIVVVSPDAGGVHRAELFAKRLNSSLAIVFKRRPEPDVAEVTDIVGEVDGRVAVVVDDMISTGGTLAKAAEAIKARGATRVYTVASHGVFADDAVEVLEDSA